MLISLSLLLFSSQIILSLTQVSSANAAQQVSAQQARTPLPQGYATGSTPTQQSTSVATPTIPFLTPNSATLVPLQLPVGQYVLYQNTTHMYLFSTTENTILPLYTPGYHYNEAVPPILMPGGQLLYSGDQGIWSTSIFDQHPSQIASFDQDTVITSMALSQDGKFIAWSTAPVDGVGQFSLYAGPIASPQLINQRSSLDCPCFRIFAFENDSHAAADSILLLTDDRGSNEALRYGLWSLDIAHPEATPHLLLGEDSQQGPLALAPSSNVLLYAPYEGAVPVPTDNSIPSDVASLSYANSLNLAALRTSSLDLSHSQVVLAPQKSLASNNQHWVTTPSFSSDGHTLAYVEFSNTNQDPYDRSSALYTVTINGSSSHIQVNHFQLLATSTTKLLELGPWLNNHIVTMYSDGVLYAMDVKSGALAILTQPGGYVRILGTVD